MNFESPEYRTLRLARCARRSAQNLRFTINGKSLVVTVQEGRAEGLIDGVQIAAGCDAAHVLHELITTARQKPILRTSAAIVGGQS